MPLRNGGFVFFWGGEKYSQPKLQIVSSILSIGSFLIFLIEQSVFFPSLIISIIPNGV